MPTTATASTVDRSAELLEQLHAGIDQLRTSDDWTRWLNVATSFHRYSFNNVVLIYCQRPDATTVAGYQAWRRLGRQVRKGEHGIKILAPHRRKRTETDEITGETTTVTRLTGFGVATVFDITQTEGPDLPDAGPRRLEGDAPGMLRHQLAALIRAQGFTYAVAELPRGHETANGVTDFTRRTVTVRPDLAKAQEAKTCAHELAHVLLHAGLTNEDRARAEVEAESVAYIVLGAHGIDAGTYSLPYVTAWSHGDPDLVAETGTRVLLTARQILDDLGHDTAE